jgi:signal transduction histidine kinase
MEVSHAQRLEATELLAGGVAHDFNNLLTVIRGSCEVLMAMTDPGDARSKVAQQIEEAAGRATALTRQLLTFSRGQVLEPREIDLNRTIAALEHICRPLVGDNIYLRWSLDPELLYVNADPAKIEQVLVNLVVNARDAMPRGGTLELQTARVSADETAAREAGAGRLVRLSVRDTGSGMSPDVKSRIFEPFFTTKAPGKGTGIGLSSVYGIVRQTGGFITVDSEVSKGTTFHVFLPESDREPGAA